MASHDFLLIQIMELIQRPSGASKEELIALLDAQGKGGVSEKTLERKLAVLRKSGIEIQYHRSQKRYRVEKTQDLRLFNAMSMSLVLSDFYTRTAEIPDFIDFGILPPQKSVENIKVVSEALQNKQCLFLRYLKFYEDQTQVYEVKPVFMRFWNNRWYLIAVKMETGEVRNFGMERIQGMRILPNVFDESFDEVREKYSHLIGISGDDRDPESIVIRTNKHGGNLFKSLKLHSSQKVLELSPDTYEVQLHVIVNQELVEILSSLQQPFEIVGPESLKTKYSAHIGFHFSQLHR